MIPVCKSFKCCKPRNKAERGLYAAQKAFQKETDIVLLIRQMRMFKKVLQKLAPKEKFEDYEPFPVEVETEESDPGEKSG